MPFDFFSEALTLIFAFPAAALLGPLSKLAGSEPKKGTSLPLAILCSLAIYLIFVLLHSFIHPLFAHSIVLSILEGIVICAFCAASLGGELSTWFKTHEKAMIALYCIIAGFAIAAVSNILYVNGRVFISLPEGTRSVNVSYAESAFSLKMVPKTRWFGSEYITIPFDEISNVRSIDLVGRNTTKMGLKDTLSPYYFGGFEGSLKDE